MRSIVVWLLLLNDLVAVPNVAVDSDSNCNEAIQSLEATGGNIGDKVWTTQGWNKEKLLLLVAASS